VAPINLRAMPQVLRLEFPLDKLVVAALATHLSVEMMEEATTTAVLLNAFQPL